MMFTRKTLFVFGAGASWHYGYPTGEELVDEVRALAKVLRQHCNIRVASGINLTQMPAIINDGPSSVLRIGVGIGHEWLALIRLCDELIERLDNVSPLVIDYFLGWNTHLANLGRLLIAGALLQPQATGSGATTHRKEKDDPAAKHKWVRYIVHQLLMPIPRTTYDLLDNEVSFLTFNYDMSFENSLSRALKSISSIPENTVDRFMENDRVLHMYGHLEPTNNLLDVKILTHGVGGTNALETITKANTLIDSWYDASKGLRVIDPHNKHDDIIAEEAQRRVQEADTIYFFGFGFDESNLSRLGFPYPINSGPLKTIYVTNFGDSMTVNKRVTKAFAVDMRNHSALSSTAYAMEKSIRNVDEAIALDFGALAE